MKGMKDFLPRRACACATTCRAKILETYRASGFRAHLHAHSGGHGEPGQERRRRQPEPDLQGAQARRQAGKGAGCRQEKELSDMGLRYDLTLPLSPLLRRQPGAAARALQGHPDRPGVPRRAPAEGPPARVRAVRHRHPGRSTAPMPRWS